MKKILIILVLLWGSNAQAQYDNFYNSIISPQKIFIPLKGSFIPNKVKTIIIKGESRKLNYSYLFKNKGLTLEYCYPENKGDSDCSYFIVNGHRVNLINHFENDFACDLDVTSFKVYTGQYHGRNYILLTCINSGSGSSSTSVICNLFDITNKKSTIYYPLWSKYGSASCFGDFNKDGVLDFVKVRSDGDNETLNVSLMSLQAGRFVSGKQGHYIILKNDNNQKVKVIKRNWF